MIKFLIWTNTISALLNVIIGITYQESDNMIVAIVNIFAVWILDRAKQNEVSRG